MTDVIDGTAAEIVASSRELARVTVTHEVIRPLEPAQVVEAMRTHQELLRRILDPSDWQGPPDAKGSFVKKSGWRKVALAYNLGLGRVAEEVQRDADGTPARATYTAWAQAPNGRRVESSGHCSIDEARFSGPRGNVSKLENDMRATAETRAKNRAISDLIGMGRVSAEEADAGPLFGPAINAAQGEQLRRAIGYTLDGLGDEQTIDDVIAAIAGKAGDYVPVIAMQAVGLVAGALKRRRDERQSERDQSGDDYVDEALRARAGIS